jgi:hypothetical protein
MVNRYGLKRYIPKPKRRSIRQRCGFGCVVCGDPFILYHHFDPPFAEAHEHRAEGITLLCERCHGDETHHRLAPDCVRQNNANPYCICAGHTRHCLVRSSISTGKPLTFKIGSATFDTRVVLMYEWEELISFKPPEAENAPWRLSAKISDLNGRELLKIVDNEWRIGIERYDITTCGETIEVREARGKVILVMQVTMDDLVHIKQLEMDCHGVRLGSDCSGVFSVSGPNGGKVILNGRVIADIGIHVRPSAKLVLLGASQDPNAGAAVAMQLVE